MTAVRHVSAAPSTRDCLRTLLAKQIVPLVLVVFFAVLVSQKVAGLNFDDIFHALRQIGPMHWAAAAFGAVVSFWAIGRMDGVVHRLLSTGAPEKTARLSGIASVAVAQLTGFGLLSGTLARWRILPDITLWQAAKITAAVSASFMIGLGALCALMVLIAAPAIPGAGLVAVVAVVTGLCAVALSVWRPRALFAFNLPSLRAQATLLALAFLDTGAAALALFVLLPTAHMPDPGLFYAIFLLALGAGLLGATPGGVGPFELMFLSCLPSLPEAPLLAAIMGFRLVYFAFPALLAVAVLLLGPGGARRAAAASEPGKAARLRPAQTSAERAIATNALCFTAARAEAGLMRQGEFDLLCDARNRPLALAAPAGQSLIMLSDPLCRDLDPAETLRALQSAARHRFLTPCVYKCSAQTAAAARRAGWTVRAMADEAWIGTAGFDIDIPGRRQLRRQLRKARAAGVEVADAGAQLPLDEMRGVAANWSAHRGVARGFSMGRFDPAYISGQRVYLARVEGRLVAFLTLHDACDERALDLMCHIAGAPGGTMHLLVAEAIAAARADGCPRLSLAAVPRRLTDSLPLPGFLAPRFDRMTGAAGLHRFKSSFAPDWEPLYVAAPGPVGLTFAGIDLIDRIVRPRDIMRVHSSSLLKI